MSRPATTPPVTGPGLVAARTLPPARSDYTRTLADPNSLDGVRQMRGIVGIIASVCLYMVCFQALAIGVVALGWLADGRPSAWHGYLTDALAFEQPWGLLGTNLGLALLIVIACGVVRWLHGVDPRWLCSVQPGMRWRYLLLCLPVALVVLGAVQLLGATGGAHAQSRIVVWMTIVVLTSPLQAAGEEFLFRGYMVQAIGSLVSPRSSARTSQVVAVLASAGIFALFHGTQNLPLFVDRFAFGLLAGWLVVATGGLEAGIACHVVNNLMAFSWAAFHGGIAGARGTTSIGWTQAAGDVLAFGLFAAVAAFLGRRMHVATRTPEARSQGSAADFELSGRTR